MPRKIRVLDLFAGAGGLTAGFHEASRRFESVAAVEMDTAAAASYEATFGEGIVFAGRIEDWLATQPMPKNIDVVVGGPPCQGFSTLGKRDEEDLRNELWRQYAETITRVEPKYFVVENVAVFEKSTQFEQFVEATAPGGVLEKYAFQHRILNAADYGAPQSRKRAVLIGHLRTLPFPGFPAPTHAPVADGTRERHAWVEDAFLGIPGDPDRDTVLGTRSVTFAGKTFSGPFSTRELHWSRDYSELSMRRFEAIPEGGNRFDIKPDDLAPCWRKHTTGSADVMGRLHTDRPSVTIRTEFFKPEKGRYLHPTKNRAITHYEAAVLQGFPPDHQFVGSKTAIARQIGNAVPIPLGAAIGRQIASAL
ncbi:DNA cytosine methyltransferase [Microbacterium dauci]|uniref:Cytosine-specific methyltransferase n=1 Tax=Microbacterium dauci TaxID=3048008 RepID=A0ABT6ZB52_9MICO|nr:DNA cytosine methyltransferase [Microbacterium sp. LX3-4]MDJ1113388.1 DNA cytosine methyltransferase [Microbacterium sp. LX3-4]